MKYFKPNTESQLKAIYDDINTTDIRSDVKYLIEWLEKQPHLPNVTGK